MSDLLADYPCTDIAYNELLDARGEVRPHWKRLLEVLEGSSPDQMSQRQA